MAINRNNVGNWIQQSLAWWMDQDIEARVNSQIDYAIQMGNGFVPGGVFGPRIPRGIGFSGDVYELRRVLDCVMAAPIVPRLVILAHYWPVSGGGVEVRQSLGISKTQYYRFLEDGLDHVARCVDRDREAA